MLSTLITDGSPVSNVIDTSLIFQRCEEMKAACEFCFPHNVVQTLRLHGLVAHIGRALHAPDGLAAYEATNGGG